MNWRYILVSALTNIVSLSRAASITQDIIRLGETQEITQMVGLFFNTSYFLILLNSGICIFQKIPVDRSIKKQRENLRSIQKSYDLLNSVLKNNEDQKHILENSNSQLEEALKAKDQVLASISHEFRNPLNSLLGYVELVQSDLKEGKHAEMLDIAKICGEMLLTLINNLLDAAKLAVGKLELSLGIANSFEFLEKFWKMHVLKLKQKNLQGEIYICKNMPANIVLDTQRMMQVLMNLMSNATKFTSSGFVKVYITWHANACIDSNLKKPAKWTSQQSTDDSKNEAIDEEFLLNDDSDDSFAENVSVSFKALEFSPKFIQDIESDMFFKFNLNQLDIKKVLKAYSQRKNGTKQKANSRGVLKFEIVDSGCGVSREAQEKLFQPFSQEGQETAKKYGGSGLGLFIIKQIITKMNGVITMHSEKNLGTDIVVLIPTTIPQDLSSASPIDCNPCTQPKLPPRYAGHKALVIDDDIYNQRIMRSFLEKLGLDVTTIGSIKETEKLFSQDMIQPFDFVTLDLHLSDGSGVECAKIIRNYENLRNITNHIPIVMITGECTEEEKNLCLDSKGPVNASFFYRKPVCFTDCQAYVKSVITAKKQNEKPLVLMVLGKDTLPPHHTLNSNKISNPKYEVFLKTKLATQALTNPTANYEAILVDCTIPIFDLRQDIVKLQTEMRKVNRIIPIFGINYKKHMTESQKQDYYQIGIKYIFYKSIDPEYIKLHIK
jgi:signal transduction histidine kinase/CheY-like chemotaxis protein